MLGLDYVEVLLCNYMYYVHVYNMCVCVHVRMGLKFQLFVNVCDNGVRALHVIMGFGVSAHSERSVVS